jgi:alkaline phosphatase D
MSTSRRTFARSLAAAGLTLSAARRLEAQTGTGLFRHGVASGDPLLNRVILWTRVTPATADPLVTVEWAIAEDANLNRIYQQGVTYTNPAFDYTVKVDVGRLEPGRTYYYQFSVGGVKSPIGRTKTLPAGTVNNLRFAFCSCSNYPYGFFNAYRMIANRADLDCVLHLGDYIYEYADGQYGAGAALGRGSLPNKEIITLSDYRERYAQYRSDPDLQEAHRQHPFIVVWDDHESANDSWWGGAENHQPATEGDWSPRRAVATQAWIEWMPVRENVYEDGQIYRTFRFGNLMDLIMLDTRLAGREQQATNVAGAFDPNRTLLGAEQESWLYRQMELSQRRATRWRMLGQQVMMGQLVDQNGPVNLDQWDGYQASRGRLLQFLGTNAINNVVVLTGDIHSSWANEISADPFTGRPSQAVEFVTPAVTSPGIDDRAQADVLQGQIGATHPHVKYVELFRRGYVVVDVTRERAQAEWYHVRTIRERQATEDFARAFRVASGETRLQVVSQPA